MRKSGFLIVSFLIIVVLFSFANQVESEEVGLNSYSPQGGNNYDLPLVNELFFDETPQEIIVAGNYAYMKRQDGLVILDISDPTKPIELSVVESIRSAAFEGLFVKGNGFVA